VLFGQYDTPMATELTGMAPWMSYIRTWSLNQSQGIGLSTEALQGSFYTLDEFVPMNTVVTFASSVFDGSDGFVTQENYLNHIYLGVQDFNPTGSTALQCTSMMGVIVVHWSPDNDDTAAYQNKNRFIPAGREIRPKN